MSELADFIDEQNANYIREDDQDNMPVKEKTLGQYLEPLIYLWFERKYDKR